MQWAVQPFQFQRFLESLSVDQALEKTYNKPAKGLSGFTGISKGKEAVLKWNIEKYENEIH